MRTILGLGLVVTLSLGWSPSFSETVVTPHSSFSSPIWKWKKGKKDAVSDEKKEESGKGGLKKFAEVITSTANSDSGFVNIYRVKDDYFMEVPFTVVGRDLLVVNKVSKVSAKLNETGLNKGINYQNLMINLEFAPQQKKLYIRENKPLVESNPNDAIHASVLDNFISTISESFSVECFNVDSTAVVVKVNKLFDGGSNSIQNIFGVLGIGTSPIKDISRIKQIKSFHDNLIARSELSTRIPGAEEDAYLTVEVTTNIVLLPEKPMVPRFADERVGLFTVPKWYITDKQQSVDKRELVTRWRLEPKPEDMERYFNGELVEPAKPIVYYIDPATPPQWRKYIKLGIEDWQAAFERAGFKNAIVAMDAPTNDPNFDPDDVRYSVVTYAASSLANAMGPSVMDPRSGEIIEADVIWWHNVMGALHRWVRLQTGLLNPAGQGNVFSDEYMGEAIRFVSSHEIGHTLGLAHNMAASFAYSVDSLRSPSFTAHSGTASSIMDYARFNYVAQPGDGVTMLTPQIGEYDKYAIEFAYRYYGAATPFEEEAKVNAFITQHKNNPLYFYGPQQDPREVVDPRSQSEDIGNDAVAASLLGVKSLKAILPQVLDWTKAEEGNYIEAGRFLHDIMDQWHLYSYHVLANVGGVYLNDRHYLADSPSYVFVPKSIQQKSVKYLVDEVLTYPEWLFGNDIFTKIYPVKNSPNGYYEFAPLELLKNYQSYVFWDMLSEERLARMYENEALNGKRAYTALDMLNQLNDALFAKTRRGQALTIQERVAQKGYVDALIIASDRGAARKEKKSIVQIDLEPKVGEHYLCSHANCSHNHDVAFTSATRRIKFTQLSRVSDIVSIKRGELLRIRNLLKQKLSITDTATQYHYQDLIMRIDDALKAE